GISMAGKMLGTRQYVLLLHALHISQSLGSNISFVLSKGAEANHRIVGIIIDIDYRRKIDLNAQALALPGDFLAHFIDQGFILNSAKRHLVREADGAV